MTSFSGLGIGLSFLFGCMVMGFAAELYYLLWVKKRLSKTSTGDHQYTTYATKLSSLYSWKKKTSASLSKISTQEVTTNSRNQDLELGTNNDMLLLSGGTAESSSCSIKLEGYREDSAELELMRLHNLRFLSTIKEETKEDLESDDGKSRGNRSRKSSKSRSFSDLTLVLTPLSSPPVKCQNSDNCQGFSFNPLFESEIKSVKSSPPPKFKFLRDAEEKLISRLIEEAERRKVLLSNGVSVMKPSSDSTVFNEERDESFISFQHLPAQEQR